MKNLQPKEAWTWLQSHPDALFVDVRMEIESLYVGRPPGVVNVPWYEYPDLQPDPRKFADAVAREATGKAQPVSTTLPASASISQPVAGDAQEKDSLMEMTQSDNPTMRVQGLSELSEGSKADAATVRSVLTHAVNDPDASVRGYAIQALAHRGGDDVMGYLWLALQDPDPSVRVLAIQSIGSQEQAIPLLQQALSDKDEAVRFIAASLLKQHKSN